MIYGDTRLPERFWTKVYPEPNTGCWLWGASKVGGGNGYGEFVFPGNKHVYAHRLVCTLAHGDAPADKPNTLHSCDVSLCVNPEHLRWGTKKENTADMLRRGRHYSPYREMPAEMKKRRWNS